MLDIMNYSAAVIIAPAAEDVMIARQISKLGAQNVGANATAKLRRRIGDGNVNRVRADFIRELETVLIGTAISAQAKINAQRFCKLIGKTRIITRCSSPLTDRQPESCWSVPCGCVRVELTTCSQPHKTMTTKAARMKCNIEFFITSATLKTVTAQSGRQRYGCKIPFRAMSSSLDSRRSGSSTQQSTGQTETHFCSS